MMKKTFIEMFENVPDYRIGNAVVHNLSEILIIALLSIISGGDTFTDMELFGKSHIGSLKQFLVLKNGIPSHDTFREVFSNLDSKYLKTGFDYWISQMLETPKSLVISIDGKAIRGTKSAWKDTVNIVTAFSSDLKIVLCQLKTDEKSNEKSTIPKLLDLFEIEGATITIDALGTQSAVASNILKKKQIMF